MVHPSTPIFPTTSGATSATPSLPFFGFPDVALLQTSQFALEYLSKGKRKENQKKRMSGEIESDGCCAVVSPRRVNGNNSSHSSHLRSLAASLLVLVSPSMWCHFFGWTVKGYTATSFPVAAPENSISFYSQFN